MSVSWLNKTSLISVSPTEKQQLGIYPLTKGSLWELWNSAPYAKWPGRSVAAGNMQTDFDPGCGLCTDA